MRGEQFYAESHLFCRLGSPPLARGTVQLTTIGHMGARITPACAGNSCLARRLLFDVEDHPRLRGEQVANTIAIVIELGSPPLARGTDPILPWPRL